MRKHWTSETPPLLGKHLGIMSGRGLEWVVPKASAMLPII
jgi:hypothetical protein